MQYKEFLEKVQAIFETNSDWGDKFENDKITIRWTSGGMQGGNCYGDDPYPISPDEPRHFVALDKILEEIAPKVGFLEYKRIERECMSEAYIPSEREYYGNYTKYSGKSLDLKGLYDLLVEMGHLCTE